jgi:hypothetical protein
VSSQVSYSTIAVPPAATHFPALKSRQQFVPPAAAAAPAPAPSDLVTFMAQMTAQMAEQSLKMEMLMSLSRVA